MHKQRRKKISKFASVAIFGLFWPFLGIFGHNLGSINDRKLVLVSNMFWDESSEKTKTFFCTQKIHFLTKNDQKRPEMGQLANFDNFYLLCLHRSQGFFC